MPILNSSGLFIGIDPGIERVGYGLIKEHGGREKLVEYGVIRTSPKQTLSERLRTLFGDLTNILKKHSSLEGAGVEDLFFSKNTKTAMLVGQARGVILLALEHAHLPIIEIKPSQAKQALTGNGCAGKKEMQKMLTLRFKLTTAPQPDDAADALAIALTASSFFHHQQLIKL